MSERLISSKTLSEGIVSGPLVILNEKKNSISKRIVLESERKNEITILKEALKNSVIDLRNLAKKLTAELGKDKADIFEGHGDIVEDEDFQNEMFDLILKEGYSAEHAAITICENNALDMESLEDDYLKARADDFRDIGNRISEAVFTVHNTKKASVVQKESAQLFPVKPSIIVASKLSPSQTVAFYLPHVLGFIVSCGGANSHAAILARSLGIPAVMVSNTERESLVENAEVILNYDKKHIIVQPNLQTKKNVEEALRVQTEKKEKRALLLDLAAETKCGYKIGLYANAGNISDLPCIALEKPDGIGLFRTEFLFMEQLELPDEAMQVAYYTEVIQSFQGKPVIFRLLDIGADKPLPYVFQPKEENPFLGWRGIRFLIDNPPILKTQIRSLLRASEITGEEIRIMIPMVISPSEVLVVDKYIKEAQSEIDARVLLGIMVETPSAALSLAAYKELIQFISIGSNDLTQYTLACDRENELLQDTYSEYHPAVLNLMYTACSTAHSFRMETGICGEFASQIGGALLLTAMGFNELSMSARAIPKVKEAIRSCFKSELQDLLNEALRCTEASEVKSLVESFIHKKALL